MTKNDTTGDLWFFITWHEGSRRLLRLVPMLDDHKTTKVISIGGMQPPPDLNVISCLLLVDRTHFLLRQPVTWGGQKLLFHNLLEVGQYFAQQAPAGSWIQVLCNRSFPLVDPASMRERLNSADFTRTFSRWHHPNVTPWREEWPEEVAEGLPAYYAGMLEELYSKGKIDKFLFLNDFNPGYRDYFQPLNSIAFNFSRDAEMLSRNVGDKLHQYLVSPFSIDSRWMSYARLNEFWDLSAETGATYSRHAHPIDIKWRHRVMSKYNLRTGDPFITASKTYVDFLLNDPRSHELFSAMNPAFCPEMNMLDTLSDTEDFGLREHMIHAFYRNDVQTCLDAEIPQAETAADEEGCFFVRKTMERESQGFIRHFGSRIEASWGEETYVSFPLASNSSATASLPSVEEIVQLIPDGSSVRLRSLKGDLRGFYMFRKDGRLASDQGGHDVSWYFHDGCLVLRFSWGEKIYRSISAEGNIIILPPDEIVSQSSEWGIFLEIEISFENDLDAEVVGTTDLDQKLLTVEGWASRSQNLALMRALEPAGDDPFFPVPVYPTQVVVALPQENKPGPLCSADGQPLALVGVAFANGRAVGLGTSNPVIDISVPDRLRASDVCGRALVSILGADVAIVLEKDGSISSADGGRLGAWTVSGAALWLIGIPELRVARIGQYFWSESGWRLSGWAWKNFKDLVTFSLVLQPRREPADLTASV